ncbi:MAG: MotA/TolQ/ExbB proton channel family protein [Planctomycetota bacterium]
MANLFNGPFDWFLVGFGLLVAGLHLVLLAGLHGRSLERNRLYQQKLATIIQLFPLGGILGTVIGLIRTMHWIGLHGSREIEPVAGQFATALSTTFWGVGFAFALTLANMLVDLRLTPTDEAGGPEQP